MIRKFFTLLQFACLHTLLFSGEPPEAFTPPNSAANIDGEPSSLVAGCVNVITGDYVDSQTDLILPASHPIAIQRTYSSSMKSGYGITKGWMFNHRGFMKTNKRDNCTEVYRILMRDDSCSTLPYVLDCDEFVLCKNLLSGMTNTSKGLISGRTNHKNTIVYNNNEKGLNARNGAGDWYTYDKRRREYEGEDIHRLFQINKANRTKINYVYHRHHLCSIKLSNHNNTLMGYISLKHVKHTFADKHTRLTSEDGREIDYILNKHKHGSYTYEVSSKCFPRQVYEYNDSIIYQKILPDNRFVHIDYYPKNAKKTRVKSLHQPVGTDASPILTHKFNYVNVTHPKEQYRIIGFQTDVYDAYNHKTVYVKLGNSFLSAIERYIGESTYQLYSKEKVYWVGDEDSGSANLVSRSFEDAAGGILFCRNYQYDQAGNVTCDALFGNLTGHNSHPVAVNENGIPQLNGCDSYSTSYAHSKDGRNLVIYEANSNHHIAYTYKAGSDLVESKYILSPEGMRQRTFYSYDEHSAVRKEINDDGCEYDKNNLRGVTQRLITSIQNTNTMPMGLPEVIKEKYLDLNTGAEVLIHKTVNKYNPQGLWIRQEHYDSNDSLAYVLERTYDDMGNLLVETNALGQATVREYDSNRNMIKEQGPCLDYYVKCNYDYVNRLISKEKICTNGEHYTESYRYDYLGNKCFSTDILGNETSYIYDEFGRCRRTIHPSCEAGVAIAEDTIYDVMGNAHYTIDAAGAVTEKRYTIRAKPYWIGHPDGSHESFEYEPSGNLVKSVAKNGSYTLYNYDYFSRPIKVETFAPNGELLKGTSARYGTFNLLEEIDPMGVATTYTYDGAGRLVQTVKGSDKATFHYNSLGKLRETRQWIDDTHYMAKIQEKDLLDRVIEERSEDQDGNITGRVEYAYDADGNKYQTIQHTSQGLAVTTQKYNVHHEVVEMTDPLGHKIITTYRNDYRNSLGQRVHYSETTDPLGNVTITIKDVLGRIASVEKKNPFGQTIQKQETVYTKTGKPVKLTQTVITPGADDRQVVTKWTYDSFGRLESLTEAAGTNEQKQTRYTYTSTGQIDAIIKPDQTEIRHTYDPLERLKHQYATDGSLDYYYTYDRNNLPIKIEDKVNGITTLKEYDPQGFLKKETLGNGLSLSYAYDGAGRPIAITFPDQSQMEHVYNAQHLKEVRRLDPQGNLLYKHIYTDFDLNGCASAATLISQAGQLTWEYDKLGRLKKIAGTNWSEEITEYDPVGNLLKRTVHDATGTIPCDYRYDDLYQLSEENTDTAHRYVCDSLYNRVNKDGKEHQINALNQLEHDGKSRYRYDLNGRLIEKSADETVHYQYDAWDRMIASTQGNKRWSYLYDSEHRRLSKTYLEKQDEDWKTLETIRYIYQGQNEVGSCDAEGKIKELRLLGLGKGAEIGSAVAIELDGHPYAPIHDHNGNVMTLIDSLSGETAATYRYSAFGEESLENTLSNPWRFSSKRTDEETGFVYFGRRYYDPATGRWSTPDPIGMESGPNLYAYVMNSPLTHIDLYGLAAIETYDQPEHLKPQGIQKPFHYAGTLIRGIGDDLLPVPFLRDAVSYCGHRMMAGATHENFKPMCRDRGSFSGSTCSDVYYPNHTISFVNGIKTRWYETQDMAYSISKAYGNCKVFYMHNSSRGFTLDLGECIALKLGLRTRTTDLMVKHIQDRIAQVGGVGRGGVVTILAHSQGGLILNNALKYLTPEQKQMLHIITFGSAAMISKKDVGSAINYVNMGDAVPRVADTIGSIRGCFSKNYDIRYLPSGFLEHGFMDESYQRMVKDHGTNFMNNFNGK